jgi:hypothetical protein
MRYSVFDSMFQRPSRPGDSILQPNATIVTADAIDTITAAKVASRVVQYTAFTAGRNLTTDTAANILAAFPDLDIGDQILFIVSCVAAFAGTYVAGTGVTLAGRATTPASSFSIIVITKTGAAAIEWRVL